MMGDERRSDPRLFFYGINLERRVRRDHPLRRVAERIDFSFVRQQGKSFYGTKGHVSEDPIVILKLMFLLFFEDVRSERELMRRIPERLDWMWFLGFSLEDTIPHHSILSKARARWGPDIFEELFVGVLRLCIRAGLVDGSRVHVDASVVDANASVDSVVGGPEALIETLRATYRREEQKLEWSKKRSAKRKLISRTDPDAAVMGRRNKKGSSRPRYKNHRVVDDKAGVITALETTPADVAEDSRLMDLIEQHEGNTEQKVTAVVADNQYGTNDNFAQCAESVALKHRWEIFQRLTQAKFVPESFRKKIFVINPRQTAIFVRLANSYTAYAIMAAGRFIRSLAAFVMLVI